MSDETSRRLGEVISERVRHYREGQGLRQEDLAQRTADFGHPINRVSIAKIEKGGTRADNLSLVDLLVLSAALNVPPTLLFLPLGRAAEVAITSAFSIPPPLALDWLNGTANLPANHDGSTPEEQWAWRTRVQPLALYRRLRELVLAVWESSGEDAEDEALRRLGTHLGYLEDAGLLVPEMPDLWLKRMVELGVRRET
jgi:transcriptional regulator with XRE-family HTH domain